jgi:acyl-CoA hydrolase
MSVTMVEVVFPGETNHHGTVFGGALLAMMDKAAFVAATRRARCPLVTVATDRVDFHAPGRLGDIIEATADVAKVGRTSIDVSVSVTAEDLLSGERREVTSGTFTFVAVGEDGRPTPIAAEPAA